MHIVIAYAITAGLWAAVSLICWSVTFPGEEAAKPTSARAFLVSPVWIFVVLWLFIGRPLRWLVIDASVGSQSSRASTHDGLMRSRRRSLSERKRDDR